MSFGWMFSIVSGHLTDVSGFPFTGWVFPREAIYFTKFDLGHIGIYVWFSSCHTLRSRRDDYLFKGEVTALETKIGFPYTVLRGHSSVGGPFSSF